MATPVSKPPPTATSPAPGAVTNSGTDAETQSKLKMFLGILRRFIGVSDMATVRFSLPSQLLEPVPNLEYWNYLDRPETFASIGDSDDELGRFLGVLRFWFTKDLKFIKGKPCKPYNSTLGEFFRCSWDIQEMLPPLDLDSRPASIASSGKVTDNTAPIVDDAPDVALIVAPSAAPSVAPSLKKHPRVSFLTEQTSHHPPVSAFFIDVPEKGITARGYDQISTKFTGTSIKVTPGIHNLGIYITLHNRGEESYRLTHPVAHLGGLLRGSLSVYVEDTSSITCPKTKIRCILHYLGDGWLGKAKHRVQGVVYRYTDETEGFERLRDVPVESIIARIDGSWVSQVYYTLAGSNERHLLMDLDPLYPVPKTCPAPEEQLPNESRKVWEKVTEAIHAKDYGRATHVKQEIEELQREKAAAREENQVKWKPRFFYDMEGRVGQPLLTEEGKKALKGLNEGVYHLESYSP